MLRHLQCLQSHKELHKYDNMLDPQALWQIVIAVLMIGQDIVKLGHAGE